MSSSRRRLDSLTFVVVWAAAALPIVLATWRAHVDGWRPISDDARIAVAGVAASHGHPPSLGAESTSLEVLSRIRPIYHPGPGEPYLLGVAHWLGRGATPLLVAVMVVNLVAVAAALLAARAIGGVGGLVICAVVLACLGTSLGVQVLGDIWNPYVAMFASVAAVLGAWAYATRRWVPGLGIVALASTWCVQAHVTQLAVLGAGIVPIAALHLLWRARRSDEDAAADPGEARPSRFAHLRKLSGPQRAGTIASLVIAGLLWVPPLAAELGPGPSNTANLARATLRGSGEATQSYAYAVNVLHRVIGTPPPFGPPRAGATVWVVARTVDPWAACVLAVLFLACLGALAGGLAARDRLTACLGASTTGMLVASALLLKQSTFSSGAAVYQTRWLWPVAALLWTAGGLTALRWVRPRLVRHRRTLAPGALAAGLVVITFTVTHAARSSTWRLEPTLQAEARSTADLVAPIERRWPAGSHLAIRVPATASGLSADPTVDVAANLIVDGYDIRFVGGTVAQRRQLGARHDGGPTGAPGPVLAVVSGDTPAPVGRLIAQVRPLDRAERADLERLRVELARRIDAAHLGWTLYGAVAHFGARPDATTLLVGDALGSAAFEGQLTGRLPPPQLIDQYRELSRRARSATRWRLLLLPS